MFNRISVAVLYPALWRRPNRSSAGQMEFAESVLISVARFKAQSETQVCVLAVRPVVPSSIHRPPQPFDGSLCSNWIDHLYWSCADIVSLIRPPVREHRSGGSRDLVGQRDDRHVVRPPPRGALDADALLLDVDQRRPRAMDQQPSQIDITAFTDVAELQMAAGTSLTGHEPEKSCEFAARLESPWITHRGDQYRRGEQADTRDVGNRAGALASLLPALDALFDWSRLLIERLQSRQLLVDRLQQKGRHDAFEIRRAHADVRQSGPASAFDRNAIPVEQSARLVDLRRTELEELRAHAVKTEHRLLVLGLYGHGAHTRLLDRGPDGTRVSGIGLVVLHERADELGVQQYHLVSQSLELARPEVCTAARLDRHLCRGTSREKFNQLLAAESPVTNLARVRLHPMHLKYLLCHIQSVYCTIDWGPPFLWWRKRAYHFGTLMPFGIARAIIM